MALGYCPYLLQHMQVVVGQNDPSTKITPPGFLKLLLDNQPSLGIPEHEKMRLSSTQGHIKEVRLWYDQRFTPADTRTEENCDNILVPARKEQTITAVSHRETSFALSDVEIRKYCDEASRTLSQGKPPTQFMQAHLRTFLNAANGLLGAMDIDLINLITFGLNVSTGLNTAKAVNINKNGTVNDLTTGVIDLLHDAYLNEFNGELLAFGSGLMQRYEMQRMARSFNQSGVNEAALGGYKWYGDIYAQAQLGTDQVGVFAPGMVGFVDIDQYVGGFARDLGTVKKFQLDLPISTVTPNVPVVTFDVHMKWIDCPEDIISGYADGENVVSSFKEGWQFIIKKNFGLWQPPTDVFKATDRLTGNNGSLRYEFTNDCENC